MAFFSSWGNAYFLSLVIICAKLLPTAESSDNDLVPTEGAVHRCHWCGPAAEQVHRSRRVGPCSADGQDELIICDPGYPYCAIVATAPPQIISKKCVKDYQDDCYTRYCNTSKLWKLTCPCKGDLCNGPITDREKTALAELMGKFNKGKRSIQNLTHATNDETATAIVLETSINVMDPNENNSIERDMKVQQRIVSDDGSNNELDKNSSSVNSFMNQYPVNKNVPVDTKDAEFAAPTMVKTDATINAVITEKPSITIVKTTSMPQIEALQQNITPTIVNNEEKLTTTTVMTTQAERTIETTIATIDKIHEITHEEIHVIVTTVKPKKAKNQSIQVVASIPVFIIYLVFCITKII